MDLTIPILLACAGVVLIGVEAFLRPGRQIAGLTGAALVLFAGIIVLKRDSALAGIVFVLVSGAVAAAVWFGHEQWVQWLDRRSADGRPAEDQRKRRDRYLGQRGTALTPLRPVGIVEVNGERIEVSTEGEFIAEGSRVRVVAMIRKQIFVRLADTTADAEVKADNA